MKLSQNIRLIASLCTTLTLSGYAMAHPLAPDTRTEPGSHATESTRSSALTPLRHTFDADADDVRLLFIVNADCHTCIAHLDNLSGGLSSQNDNSRLRIFVVYTSKAAARNKPRVSAPGSRGEQARLYWDPDATLAQRYRKVLGIHLNKRGMWMIYGRRQQWIGRLPPKPDFWMHQLNDAPGANHSNRMEFSRRVTFYLAKLKSAPSQSQRGNESGSRAR